MISSPKLLIFTLSTLRRVYFRRAEQVVSWLAPLLASFREILQSKICICIASLLSICRVHIKAFGAFVVLQECGFFNFFVYSVFVASVQLEFSSEM